MKFKLSIIAFLIPLFVKSQMATINATFEQVNVDHLGNIYLLENNTLSKYNKQGEFLFSYNNSSIGTIASFDVTDPLKILIYDQEYNQICFLNAQLALISDQISLDDLGINVSELACKSAKEGFWVYDAVSRELKYFNQLNLLISQSIKIDQIIEYSESPNFLVERNNQVFLNFKSKGILVFDKFGTYLKKIPITQLEDFQLVKNNIIYFRNDTVFENNIVFYSQTFNTNNYMLGAIKVLISSDLNFVIAKNKIQIYKN